MDLRTLVASILASITSGDANSIYALALVARDELGLKLEISPMAVGEALRQLTEEGYAAEYGIFNAAPGYSIPLSCLFKTVTTLASKNFFTKARGFVQSS